MKSRTTAVAAVAALALPGASLAAAPSSAGESQGKGKAAAPGQLCKSESRKKTMRGKGQSPFAACVVGVKRAERVAEANESRPADRQRTINPAKLCKDRSRKKAKTDKKSPFAACVSGAAKAQREAEQAA